MSAKLLSAFITIRKILPCEVLLTRTPSIVEERIFATSLFEASQKHSQIKSPTNGSSVRSMVKSVSFGILQQ